MRTLFLVLPLLTASAAYAQLEPATVYNATSSAPVAITGNVTCSEEIKDSKLYITAAGELTFTNISSRNIGGGGLEALSISAVAVFLITTERGFHRISLMLRSTRNKLIS